MHYTHTPSIPECLYPKQRWLTDLYFIPYALLQASVWGVERTSTDAREPMPLPEIQNHGGAWSIIFRSIANKDGVEGACSIVRDRLVSEWQNNAMVQSLLLGMVVGMALAPPDGSDPHDVAFRVYLYGSGFSTLFLGVAVLLDVMLLYQLNMMDDEMLQHFIVWMGRFRLPFASPTGLPDVLQMLTLFGLLTFLMALCAAFHTLGSPTDAWVLSGVAIALAAMLLGFSIRVDQLKWESLNRLGISNKVSP